MTTMLAARAREGATSVKLEKAEVPELGPENVLVMVVAAGLTCSEMAPLIYGHRVFGTHSRFAYRPRRPIADMIAACAH
jgi:D-arabinose 1-dehydrogenase-like Zn-dependent alcohol dehydrogenase